MRKFQKQNETNRNETWPPSLWMIPHLFALVFCALSCIPPRPSASSFRLLPFTPPHSNLSHLYQICLYQIYCNSCLSEFVSECLWYDVSQPWCVSAASLVAGVAPRHSRGSLALPISTKFVSTKLIPANLTGIELISTRPSSTKLISIKLIYIRLTLTNLSLSNLFLSKIKIVIYHISSHLSQAFLRQTYLHETYL